MKFETRRVQLILIHIGVWALFYGFFLFPFFFQLRQVPPDLPIRLVLTVVLFYLNYFLLVPYILLKKNTMTYIAICVLLVVLAGLSIHIGFVPEPNLPPFIRNDLEFHGPNPFIGQFFTMINLSTPIFISGLLKMYVEWRKNEDLRKKVENEKVSSELQFLKTQLNPHFLFNSLNTIYSLSVKSSNYTSDAVMSLSELMRYMLYEADKDRVPLRKELEYIKNYVQLQKLRLSDSANVLLKMSGEDKGKEVPPLLFISFIENAFKYGTDYQGKTYVKINLKIEPNRIFFMVENKIGVHIKKQKSSGVGLENIKNRLRLLYPKNHELKIFDDGSTFRVELGLLL
jgi:sensor histidine kinase YesM